MSIELNGFTPTLPGHPVNKLYVDNATQDSVKVVSPQIDSVPKWNGSEWTPSIVSGGGSDTVYFI